MSSILLILPYFGKWPVWFDAFLISVSKNETINWLIITDCEIPEEYPENIRFISTNLTEINQKINVTVGASVPLFPIKFCDLKPAYGDIFKEYIEGYDFWGFCDMDIILGDIRKYITDDVLNNYDIISSRKEAISGHFNLFRNTPGLYQLYKLVDNYKFLFEQPKFMWFDEGVFESFIKSGIEDNSLEYKVYWPKILLNQERGIDSHQEYHLDQWLWKDGKILGLKNGKYTNEVMYLHFINWKKTLKYSEVKYKDNPSQFYISYSGIHYKPHNLFQNIWNNSVNIFNGYYKKEWRRIFKMKLLKKTKSALNKFKIK